MSCDVEMLPVKKRPRRAVVITLSKAHDQGHTSCVFCLSLRRDKEEGLPGGGTCSLVPQKKLEFFPCSPKIN